MKTNIKKLIAFLLCIALILTSLAVPVNAKTAKAKEFNIIKSITSLFNGNSDKKKTKKDDNNTSSTNSKKKSLKKESDTENELIFPATPSAVTGVAVTKSFSDNESASQILTWDAADSADYYEVDVNTPDFNAESVSVASVKVDDTSYKSEGLSPMTPYSYRVRAVAMSPTGTAVIGPYSYTVMDYTPPLTPDKPAKEHVRNTEATIIWKDAPAVTGASIYYNVYRSLNDNNYELYSANITTTSFEDIYLNPDTEYYYKIQTVGVIGDVIKESELSEALMIKTTNNISPEAVTGLKLEKTSEGMISFSWDKKEDTSEYRIYRYNTETNRYERIASTQDNNFVDTNLERGTTYSYKVTALSIDGTAESPMSDALNAVTHPSAPVSVTTKTTTSSAVLTWKEESTYTGFIIYRYNEDTGVYDIIGTTADTTFTDTPLSPGINLSYKIQAYINTTEHTSLFSETVNTSTLPLAPTLKIKVGAKRVRLMWNSISNSDGYIIYRKTPDSEYTQVFKNSSKSTVKKIITSLTNNTKYSFKICSYRKAFGNEYISPRSQAISGTPKKITTSTVPKLYKTKKALINSSAWKKVKKLAVYSKSIIIPGMTSTNIVGFNSDSMCPQGMCIAGKYMLIGAYDQNKEENSVIYVIELSSKKLKTVIVLPNKTHCGGLTYDGEEVWVTNGTKVCSISFSQINAAAKKGSTYKKLSYTSTLQTGKTASFITFYKDMLWVGTYNTSNTTSLYSFHIGLDEDEKNILTRHYVGTFPSRAQGMCFNSSGRLIVSRAYAYTHELVIYKPKFKGKKITLGSKIKTVTMPFLGQNVDIKGNYLYISFESAGGSNSKSPDHMDRIIALNLKKTLKVAKKKKK